MPRRVKYVFSVHRSSLGTLKLQVENIINEFNSENIMHHHHSYELTLSSPSVHGTLSQKNHNAHNAKQLLMSC